MKLSEQDQGLYNTIEKWLIESKELEKFRESAYPTKREMRKHLARRRERILHFVEVFKMLLQGGSYHIPGMMIPEKTTINVTTVEIDAVSLMAIICGQIDRATGFEPIKKAPPSEEEKYYTHS